MQGDEILWIDTDKVKHMRGFIRTINHITEHCIFYFLKNLTRLIFRLIAVLPKRIDLRNMSLAVTSVSVGRILCLTFALCKCKSQNNSISLYVIALRSFSAFYSRVVHDESSEKRPQLLTLCHSPLSLG